jgi:hypothetical protein
MSSYRFNGTANQLARGGINLLTDTFYIALVTSLPSASVATRAAILNECTGGNYVRKDLTKTNSSPFLYLSNSSAVTFANPVWTGLWTATNTPVVGGIILKGTVAGSQGTDIALGFISLDPTYSVPASPTPTPPSFTFVFNPAGAIFIGQ